MPLRVREVFPTVQGEGSITGTPAVFLRLTGCNLWSGHESGRASGRGACALWCDTDFASGKAWEPILLSELIQEMMDGWAAPTVVITGGEPCLQLRKKPGEQLVRLLQAANVTTCIETNGTVECDVLSQLDHVTVSPKQMKGSESLDHIKVRTGTDLKVVVPQWSLKAMLEMNLWDFDFRFAQPLDQHGTESTEPCVAAARNMGWRISVQTHKYMGWP